MEFFIQREKFTQNFLILRNTNEEIILETWRLKISPKTKYFDLKNYKTAHLFGKNLKKLQTLIVKTLQYH